MENTLHNRPRIGWHRLCEDVSAREATRRPGIFAARGEFSLFLEPFDRSGGKDHKYREACTVRTSTELAAHFFSRICSHRQNLLLLRFTQHKNSVNHEQTGWSGICDFFGAPFNFSVFNMSTSLLVLLFGVILVGECVRASIQRSIPPGFLQASLAHADFLSFCAR